MAPLQSLTGKGIGAQSQSRRWPIIGSGAKSRSARRELLGLDIGSVLIKGVLLSREEGEMTLTDAMLTPTPEGVVTAGELTDAITVADSLRKICRERRLKTRQVAVAVSGEKVYAQVENLPLEFKDDLGEFVQDAMLKVIPYSIDGAAFDYERLEEGTVSGPAVLWVSSGSEQVEWVREAVSLAGKSVAVVDAQACALANAYAFNYQPAAKEIVVLLHAGPRQMTVALMRGGLLLWSRDATLSREKQPLEPGPLATLAIDELERRWDSMAQQIVPAEPAKCYVSGGAAKSGEFRDAIGQWMGLPVEELNPFRAISFSPEKESGQYAADYGGTLPVAVGLALRGFEDL